MRCGISYSRFEGVQIKLGENRRTYHEHSHGQCFGFHGHSRDDNGIAFRNGKKLFLEGKNYVKGNKLAYQNEE